MVERGDANDGGVTTTISGVVIPLWNVKAEHLVLADIAHALSSINRFNGHSIRPYSVLSHSLCAAELMPEGKKMEGLLHDAAEAYIGDIITPVKELFPEICVYEDKLLAQILCKFDVNSETTIEAGAYKKSKVMLYVDRKLGMGEYQVLQPNTDHTLNGEYDEYVELLMNKYWDATPQDFLDKYEELIL